MAEKTSMLEEAKDGNWRTEKKKAGNGNGGQGPDVQVTVNGYDIGEVVSALQKSIRRGKEKEALYWTSELLASNQQYRFWRRLTTIAAEDIGLADPQALILVEACNSSARIAQEWNVPFMAVMYCCRAPKNREADDAAYLYEIRRKKNWKIPMNPEARDGHTRAGRTALYRQADREGANWEDLWNREFYYGAAALKNYQELPGGDKYRRVLMADLGLALDTYEIDQIKTRWWFDGEQGAGEMKFDPATEGRIPDEVTIVRADSDGVVLPDGQAHVESFTTPGTWYEVDINSVTCTCPAHMKTGGVCKHILAVMKAERQ